MSKKIKPAAVAAGAVAAKASARITSHPVLRSPLLAEVVNGSNALPGPAAVLAIHNL